MGKKIQQHKNADQLSPQSLMTERLTNKVAINCEQSEITHIEKIVKKSFLAITTATHKNIDKA